MSRTLKVVTGIMVVLVVIAIIALPSLRQAVRRLGGTPPTEQQARREVMQPTISTPTDVKVNAQLYWLSESPHTSLDATNIELPLSADPVERSKQLLNALIVNAPAGRRILPADATLLGFYILPDGTAIADFADELSLEATSGILSEQLAIDSIVQTLGANVSGIQRLKILIHGQETETLGGHIDLTGLFPVSSATPAPATDTAAPPAAPAPTADENPSLKPAAPAPSAAAPVN